MKIYIFLLFKYLLKIFLRISVFKNASNAIVLDSNCILILIDTIVQLFRVHYEYNMTEALKLFQGNVFIISNYLFIFFCKITVVMKTKISILLVSINIRI